MLGLAWDSFFLAFPITVVTSLLSFSLTHGQHRSDSHNLANGAARQTGHEVLLLLLVAGRRLRHAEGLFRVAE